MAIVEPRLRNLGERFRGAPDAKARRARARWAAHDQPPRREAMPATALAAEADFAEHLAPAPVAVAAADITRRYGEGDTAVDALRGVSLDVADGRLTAIMGPSGSGKSTLMHILAGLDQPTSGTVRLDGVEITGLSDKRLTRLRREKIGFVFQFFNLLPMLTAEENVVLPLTIAGRKPEREWVDGLLPTFGFGVDSSQPRFNPLHLVAGRWASGRHEVVIDFNTAKKHDFGVGDSIEAAGKGPKERFRISGIAKYGDVDTLGGATIAVFTIPTAQHLLRLDGYTAISVAARSGVSRAQLVRRIEQVVPADVQVKTGDEQAKSDKKDVQTFLSVIRGFLLGFGGIALFVGAFVIFNTLSITVAQRTRELATLRTLGASRRQVLRLVVAESLAIGLTASTAAALMIGLALVSFVAVLGKGLHGSVDRALRDQVNADWVVSSKNGWSAFTAAAGTAAEQTPGIIRSTSIRSDRGRVANANATVNGVDPKTVAGLYHFDWRQGSDATLAKLDGSGALVKRWFAKKHHLRLGESFTVRTPAGKPLHLRVVGIFQPPRLYELLGAIVISKD